MTAHPTIAIHPPTRPGPLALTPQQYEWLLTQIPRGRVSQDPRGNSHVEQWDVRRTLTRIFGFGGWEVHTKRLWLIREIENPPGTVTVKGRPNDRTVWTAVYGAEVALTVYGLEGTSATFEDGATGDSQNLPACGDAHDQALKTSLSQALKRCAVNLGDQFGLALYSDSTDAVVKSTLRPPAPPAGSTPAPAALPTNDPPVRPESGHDDDGQTYVDPDDGQTYVTPPSGGLADDMRDADVHPLPSAHRTPEGQRALAQAGTVTPLRRGPVEEAPAGETAAQRAIRQRREADQARHRPDPAKGRNDRDPAVWPTQPAADDGEAAALVEEILACTDMKRFTALWNMGKQLARAGLDTDVRRMLSDDAAALLTLDRSQPVPLGAVVQRSAKHFERAAVSVRMALDPAPVPTP